MSVRFSTLKRNTLGGSGHRWGNKKTDMKKLSKQKTHDMLNRSLSGLDNGRAWTIVNEAINEVDGDYDQLRDSLADTSKALSIVNHALAVFKDEIEA